MCKLRVATCIAAVLGWNLLFSAISAGAGEIRIIVGPYLQNVQENGITIMWETNVAAPSRVDYGKTKTCDTSTASDDLVTIHEITISGLTVETGYYYKVSSAEAQSEVCTFMTSVKRDTPFTFAVYGDSRGGTQGMPQRNSKRHKRIADEVASRKPNLVINTGDIVAWGPNGKQQFRDEHFGPARELFKNIPSYVAIGNHEKDTPDFYEYVSHPAPEHENYYSVDYGNVHFVILDSLPYAHIDQSGFWPPPGYPGSRSALERADAQTKWLEDDLKSTNATWKFVFFHHPVYGSAEEKKTQESLKQRVVPVFEKYGVDVVFVGHSHRYQRTHPMKDGKIDKEGGIPHITAGGGGAGLGGLPPTKPDFTAKQWREYHYCLVEIDGNQFDMKVFSIKGWEPGEQIHTTKLLDTLTIRK